MSKTKKNRFSPGILVIVLGVIAILVLVGYPFIASFNDTQYIITITDKERVNGGDSSRYLIFGENENGEMLVFEDTDNLLRWKWNSSDIYGELKIGSTYKVTVVGFRIRLMSQYQNIIKYEEA